MSKSDVKASLLGLGWVLLVFACGFLPAWGIIALLHLFFPYGYWVLLPPFITGTADMLFWRYIFRDKPAQLEAPKSGLEKLKEQYALGEIDIAKLEQGVERELYVQAHAIEAPKPAPALPAPKPKQVEPARPWHYQGRVSDYEMEAMRASYDAWLWRTREDRV